MTREEAIKKLRQMTLPEETREILVALAPELAESEDERIINTIISFLRVTSFYSCNGCKKSEMIAWLEKQKEQHPSPRFLPGDWAVYDGPLGHAILQIKDVIDGRYTFVDNDSTLLVEDSDKFLRPLTPEDMEKPAEWSVGNYDIISNISYQVYKAIRRTLASLAVYDEDEKLLESKEATLCYYSQQCAEAILKSFRPSWKPGEEQMSMLLAVINDPNNAGAESCYMALKSIYNNLKKL